MLPWVQAEADPQRLMAAQISVKDKSVLIGEMPIIGTATMRMAKHWKNRGREETCDGRVHSTGVSTGSR
jgi:hypothetical protein